MTSTQRISITDLFEACQDDIANLRPGTMIYVVDLNPPRS